ncbi:MAG: DUF6049 family protein [Mycobacteriales bacterium]|nr:DUF6049 family protein [Frankia sp.]
MTRRWRATAAAAAALVLGAGVATDARAQSADEAMPTTLAIARLNRFLSPGVGHDHVLSIRGTVVNTGTTTLRDVRVRLVIGNPVRSRSELAERAAEPSGEGVATRAVDIADELVPGGSAPVRYDIRADQLPVVGRSPSVHPLRIELRSRTGGRGFTRVGVADTFLPWWPGRTVRTRLAWVWPLLQPSPVRADELFAGDSLADAVSDNGRLSDIVDAVRDAGARVTWAVDPELLEAVDRMTRRYRVITADGKVTAVRPNRAAGTWLSGTRTELSAGEVLATPYGDPDVVALVRAGLGSDVTNAVAVGQAVLARLGLAADTRLQWPPAGALDAQSLDALVGAGASGVVVSADTVPADPEANFTPSAPTVLSALGRTVTALVGDATLSNLVAQGPLPGAGTTLALQRWAAETAMFTLERPSTARDVVVTPPRVWAPDRAFARGLLSLPRTLPWLDPVLLSDVARDEPVTTGRASTLTYGAADIDAELPAPFLADVGRTRTALRHFRTIFTSPNPLSEQLDAALLRAESSLWRDDIDGARALLDEVTDLLGRQQAKIHVFAKGLITLTSKTGQIPITIVNDLDHEIRISVRLRSTALILGNDVSGEQVIQPRSTRTFPIEGRATKAGIFEIGVRLLTPDGAQLSSSTLRVRSTAYGAVALGITGGAFAILTAAIVVRVLRRRRRRNAEPLAVAAPA